MKKHTILIAIFSLFALGLMANPTLYFPTNTLVENFGATWCGACAFAQMGLDIIEDEVFGGEVIFSRLLTESGEYSPASVEERFDYYGVLGLPAVIFNGKIRINGSDDEVANGSLYREALNKFRYLGSPIQLKALSYDHIQGEYSFGISVENEDFVVEDAVLMLYIMEDNLPGGLTRIVRDVHSQEFSLPSPGSITLNFSIDNDPNWNPANLWAVAFVQFPSGGIVQAVSTLAQPERQVRVALPFDIDIRVDEPGNYFSEDFSIFNYGPAAVLTTYIEAVDTPDDWYLNYCDESNCYPGQFSFDHNFAEDGWLQFHLNIFTNSMGVGFFNFVIESEFQEPYKIPFKYTVGPVANEDLVLPTYGLKVKSSYPNPFKDQLSLDIVSEKDMPTLKVELYNLKGQKVKELNAGSLKAGENTLRMHLGDIADGIYFYRLSGSKTNYKLLKLN